MFHRREGFHRLCEDIKKRARSAPAHVDTRDFDAGDLFLLLHLAAREISKNQIVGRVQGKTFKVALNREFAGFTI